MSATIRLDNPNRKRKATTGATHGRVVASAKISKKSKPKSTTVYSKAVMGKPTQTRVTIMGDPHKIIFEADHSKSKDVSDGLAPEENCIWTKAKIYSQDMSANGAFAGGIEKMRKTDYANRIISIRLAGISWNFTVNPGGVRNSGEEEAGTRMTGLTLLAKPVISASEDPDHAYKFMMCEKGVIRKGRSDNTPVLMKMTPTNKARFDTYNAQTCTFSGNIDSLKSWIDMDQFKTTIMDTESSNKLRIFGLKFQAYAPKNILGDLDMLDRRLGYLTPVLTFDILLRDSAAAS